MLKSGLDGAQRRPMRLAMLGAITLSALGPAAHAAALLQYEFNGQPGTETSVASINPAAGLTGLAFTESGVSPNAGANSINASGFNNAGAYYQFGFNVASGFSATVNQLVLGTRSSNTGPGTINVLASADGGAYKTVASISENTSDIYQMLSLTSSVTGLNSIVFRFVSANQTSATGGSVGSAGTFRVEDYSSSGASTPFTLNGSVATVSAAPEPGAWVLMLGGVAATGLRLRRRRSAALAA